MNITRVHAVVDGNDVKAVLLQPAGDHSTPAILMSEEEYDLLDEQIGSLTVQLDEALAALKLSNEQLETMTACANEGAKQIAELTDQLRALHEQVSA